MNRPQKALRYFTQFRSETDARIRGGIEQYRKGDATLRFVSGKKLPENITVEIEQLSHEFRFGANLFQLDECECAEKNQRYREVFPELFNLATLPFYWRDQEPEPGKLRFAASSPRIYRRPPAELCLSYCSEKNIEPKAHCLNYDHERPAWIAHAPIEAHQAALEKRFAELSERYAARIPSWEVTNETFNLTFARDFLEQQNYSLFYREGNFNDWSFRLADRYFPNNHLIINDHLDFGCLRSPFGEYFGKRSPYYLEIDRLGREGIRHLDSVGFQYHCFFRKEQEEEIAVTRYHPRHLFDILDTYATLGKKLQITETTLSAYSAEAQDEETQALLAENLYSLFFSHPAMEAIIYWNLVDGYACGATPGEMQHGENQFYGGLLRFDFSEKPAYQVLRRLIRETWHTSLTKTACGNTLSFRGFYGTYRLRIHAGEKTCTREIKLSASGENHFEITLDL